MASIVLQKGHCFRTRGATGTRDEQKFASACVDRVAPLLRQRGHVVHVVLADTAAPYPRSDAFIAFHTDGSTNRSRRGASVGYPDEAGRRLAHAWKAAHQRRGFPGGFLNDNYTTALRSYYGFGRSRSPRRFLAEHGTTTNDADHRWLFDNLEAAAMAHVDAIGAVFGHPHGGDTPAPAPTPEEDDLRRLIQIRPGSSPAIYVTDGIRVRWVQSMGEAEWLIRELKVPREPAPIIQGEFDRLEYVGARPPA